MSFSWSHGWLRAWRFTVSCVCVMSSPYISDLPPSSTPRSPASGENTSRQRGASSATSRPEPRLNGFLTVLVLIRTEHDAREANLLLLQSRTLCIGSVRVPNTPPMDLISRIRFRPLAGAPRSVSSDCNLVGFQSRWLWEGDARFRRLMGGDDIGRITAESEEVSRFSGGRTLHQLWTDCGSSFPSLLSSNRQSSGWEVFLPTEETIRCLYKTRLW